MRREWRKERSGKLRGKSRRIFDPSVSHALSCREICMVYMVFKDC